eukprot:1990562-Rhodomonas_salina.1
MARLEAAEGGREEEARRKNEEEREEAHAKVTCDDARAEERAIHMPAASRPKHALDAHILFADLISRRWPLGPLRARGLLAGHSILLPVHRCVGRGAGVRGRRERGAQRHRPQQPPLLPEFPSFPTFL